MVSANRTPREMIDKMAVLAHGGEGHGWGTLIEPWEFHPMLIHFPIAFLLGGVALDLYAWWRKRPDLDLLTNRFFIAGVLSGILAAGAGVWAMFTHPESLTEQAERLMTWHLWIQVAALFLFAAVAWVRWRQGAVPPSTLTRLAGWVAAVTLVIGSAIGGYIVYHGGAGIESGLMKPHGR